MDANEKELFKAVSVHFNQSPNIIDVGGNIGLWSESVLDMVTPGKMYIFEPETKNFEILNYKFVKNNNIIVTNKGLGDKCTSKTYFDMISDNVDVRGLGGFIKRSVYDNYNYKTHDFEIITLDSFFAKSIDVDYIKIDVEGFELNVMKGMTNMLSKSMFKFIQFEYGGTYLDANIKLNDIISHLKQYGYFVYEYKDAKFTKIIDYIDNYEYNNFIATKIDLNE